MCWGFCLRTWIEALNADGVDQASELRDPEKVFCPLAIRVKLATFANDSIAPSVSLASVEPSDPTPNDKTPTVPPTFSENEGPTLENTGSSVPHPSTKGQVSQEAEKDMKPKEQGKELPK